MRIHRSRTAFILACVALPAMITSACARCNKPSDSQIAQVIFAQFVKTYNSYGNTQKGVDILRMTTNTQCTQATFVARQQEVHQNYDGTRIASHEDWNGVLSRDDAGKWSVFISSGPLGATWTLDVP